VEGGPIQYVPQGGLDIDMIVGRKTKRHDRAEKKGGEAYEKTRGRGKKVKAGKKTETC